jgi:RNA polymerase sigma factor (sigma-70 family)
MISTSIRFLAAPLTGAMGAPTMPNGDSWHIVLRDYFTHHALQREQAEECVTQVFLRYSTKAGAPPWDGDTPSPLLWRLARDVMCEHFRQQARQKQRAEKLQGTLAGTLPICPDVLAVDRLDAERFADALPDRLREVLELRLQGYTCADIAKRLALSPGTVKGYLAELRKKFVQYYGYDPTKTPSRDGNIYGSLSGVEASVSHQEGQREDAFEEVSGVDGSGSVRGERVRSAPHSRRVGRARGGDGSRTVMVGQENPITCKADSVTFTTVRQAQYM